MPRGKATTKKVSAKKDSIVVDVYSLAGKKVDKFQLDPDIFSSQVNKSLLHQVLSMYSANKRQGNASTKTRAYVRGGGKKPWRQKGTGRARAGSIRSPLWKGGGIVFGPRPKDYSYTLPRKMLKHALISGLSLRAKDNEILLLEKDPELKSPKTKEIAKLLSSLKVDNKKVLFLLAKNDKNLILSCRNIKNIDYKNYIDFNAHDVVVSSRVIFSKETHDAIVKRLKK